MIRIFCMTLMLALLSYNVYSQKKIDTIYIKAYIEDLDSKYNSIRTNDATSFISFIFNIKWEIYGDPMDKITFEYRSSPNRPHNEWLSTIIDSKKVTQFKTVYTLKELTDQLNKTSLKEDIYRKKFILLYGSKKPKKYELYPVKIYDGSWDPPHIIIPKSNN